jgi:hypothetical protein
MKTMAPSLDSIAWRGCALALAVFAAGCTSVEAPRFHSLLPSASEPARALEGGPLYIDLGPVGIPASVDQPQWVVRTADDSLRMLERERWVGPLRDELRGALAERLGRHWGAIDVRSSPAPTSVGWRVRVDVQRFESVAGREVRVDSLWSATSLKNPSTAFTCRMSLHEPATGELPALTAAHRRAVTRLADHIGARLRAIDSGEAVGCGAA